MRLIIVDAESAYAGNLVNRLSVNRPYINGAACNSLEDLAKAVQTDTSGPVLCLYNHRDFPDLSNWLNNCDVQQEWTLWCIVPGKLAEKENSIPSFSRLEFSSIFKAVGRWIDDTAKKESIPEPGNESQSSKTESWLYFSIDPQNQNKYVREKLKQKLAEGCRTIYLPLMPTYYMELIVHPDSGPDMSDLLLNIFGDNLASNQIARYWQPHPEGYFQFRPPNCSDDLTTCEPDILRQLIIFLIEHLKKDSQLSAVIIDCKSIPLAAVRTAAVLCDYCVTDIPTGSGFALEAGQREINVLLAELPASCRIIHTQDTPAKIDSSIHPGNDNVS